VKTEGEKLVDRFIQFYRNYYEDEIDTLAEEYPDQRRSLYVDYNDLFTFDRDLAEDWITKPDRIQEYAEEALRLYDLPGDVSLGQAHVRLYNLPSEEDLDVTDIRAWDDVVGSLIRTDVYVQSVSEVEARATEAAFECQRCGTMTYIPQSDNGLTEPSKCQGCEREGPFDVITNQTEYVDSQTITVGPLPESDTASNGELTGYLEDDLAGEVAQGERVRLVSVLVGETNRSGTLDLKLDVVSVEELERSVDEFWSSEFEFAGTIHELDQQVFEDFASHAKAVLETQTLDETATRTKIITPFIGLLGWRVMHPEVAVEYTSEPLGGKDRADYVLRDDGSDPAIVVEAKQEGTPLSSHEGQLKRYMRNFGAVLGLLTNGESFRFIASDPRSDMPEEVELVSCSLDELEYHLDTLKLFYQETHVGENSDESVVDVAIQQIEQEQKGEFDESEVDTETWENEEDLVKEVISQTEESYDEGAPVEVVVEKLVERGFVKKEAKQGIESLRKQGELYEPVQGHLRTT